MGLRWGIFFRMRALVVDTNKMVEKQGAMMKMQGKLLKEVRRTLTNCVITKLEEHDERFKRIEEKLKIPVKE